MHERFFKLPSKKCGKCKLIKPVELFRLINEDTGRRGSFCTNCYKCTYANGYDYPYEHPAPNPCSQCGETYSLNRPPNMLARRKYCSDECRIASTRKTGQCIRCEKMLPYEAFDRNNSRRARKRVCRQCDRDRNPDPVGGRRIENRSSPYQMYKNLLTWARKAGCRTNLTASAARRLYNKPCCLCGGAVTALRPGANESYQAADLRGYCRRCVKLIRVFSHDDLLALIREIAGRHPAERGESERGQNAQSTAKGHPVT